MPTRSRERKRVVVTGMGAITAQGTSAEALWQGVKGGAVAIREVRHLPMDGYRTRLGGEVQQESPPEHDYRHPAGFRDRAIDFTLTAAEEALENCGVAATAQVPPERWGVVIGTCNAGLLSGAEWYTRAMAGDSPDPRLVLLVPPQAMAEALSGAFDMKGPVISIDTACAASANAIGYAAELIRDGQADAVLTGGADAFSDILYAGFNSLESLSPKPAAPYSRDRQGLSLGEGSGMLVLMAEDRAREAGAPVLAEVLSYGLSADGYHATAPHPEGRGAARAIRAALAAAGVRADEVGYVNSHGTGTAKNDPAETAATRAGLEEAADRVAVSSTKSMIGHLLGGAGAVEAIVTVKMLEDQVAPPTANYREPDPECDLDYVPNKARPLTTDVAVSNNFAFGGANASIVFARRGARDTGPPPPPLDRVAITGLATLTSAGTDPDEVWRAFAEQRRGTEVEAGVYIGRVAFDPSEFLTPRERRRMDRLGIFAVVASRLSLEDAGIELTDENRDRVGVILGTGVGPMESMEAFARPVIEEGAGAANPAVFPNTVYNAAGGQVAMNVHALGPASTVTAGHAAGAAAICYGYDLAATDHADAVISLGVDALTDAVIRAYRELGVVAGAPPGSDDVQGFGLAEAGIALVLERLSGARARDARIYGEILGYGITSDAMGVGRFDPEGSGVERAMRLALERAELSPDDLGAVWASSAGLQSADAAETAALARLFGAEANVVAPKVLLGEPMGAGGALNAALALKGWEQGLEAAGVGPVLVSSCSLGGTNFSFVLAPYRDEASGGR